MTIEEQLKDIILSKYKSIRAFATDADIPYSTIDSMLKRGIKNAGISTTIKIFSALGLDVESISTGTLEPAKGQMPKDDELFDVLRGNYELLNREGQEVLVNLSTGLVASGAYIKTGASELGREA